MPCHPINPIIKVAPTENQRYNSRAVSCTEVDPFQLVFVMFEHWKC